MIQKTASRTTKGLGMHANESLANWKVVTNTYLAYLPDDNRANKSSKSLLWQKLRFGSGFNLCSTNKAIEPKQSHSEWFVV